MNHSTAESFNNLYSKNFENLIPNKILVEP